MNDDPARGSQAPPRPRPRDLAEMLVLGTIWGGNFLLIKLAVETIPPASFATLRLLLAAAVVAVLALIAGESFRFGRRTWGPLLLVAVTGNALPFMLIGWGQQHIEAGLAAICMAVMPLSTLLLAHFVTRDEKLSLPKAIGVGLGFLGLIVLIGPHRLSALGSDALATLAICAGAFSYGVSVLLARHLRDQPLRAMAAVTFFIAALIALPVALIADAPWTLTPSATSLLAIVAIAILPTGLGTVQMFGLIKRLGATFFSQINFIVPVAGVFLGALFLGERLPPAAFAALALILAGLTVARLRF